MTSPGGAPSTQAPDAGSKPSRARLLSFGIGIAGGILGLAPWLIGGGVLPLQNLWATSTMPEDMPFVLLPVSQYFASLLFSLVLMGGVFAGIAVHVVARRRRVSAWPAALGVLFVHVIAVVQSFGVLSEGLGLGSTEYSRVTLYFAGMLGGAIASALLAQLGFWMTSRRSVGVAAFGVALAAVPFGSWVARWVVAVTGEVSPPTFLSTVVVWLPAVVVGLALLWCGVRPLWRLAVWVVSLLMLWVVPALITATGAGLGMRVLQGDLVEMARVAVQVFPMALVIVWMPVVAALGMAVVGTVARMVVERRRPDAAPQLERDDATAGDGR